VNWPDSYSYIPSDYLVILRVLYFASDVNIYMYEKMAILPHGAGYMKIKLFHEEQGYESGCLLRDLTKGLAYKSGDSWL
jgi:hypothetical protein